MSGDRNRTIRLTIDMTYNAEQMHHDDPEGIRWFNEEVLGGALQMWSDEIGDWIGSVQIVEPPAAAPDLLAALKAAVSMYGKPGGPYNNSFDGAWIEQAHAAIERAEGRAE